MTPKGVRHTLCLVFALVASICNTSYAQNKYTDFIQFKKVLYEVSVLQITTVLYFRLANYFNYNFSQLFPQVMVGYSTRLTGMIKNFRNGAAER